MLTEDEVRAEVGAIIDRLGPGLRLEVDGRVLASMFCRRLPPAPRDVIVKRAKEFAEARGAFFIPSDLKDSHEIAGRFGRAYYKTADSCPTSPKDPGTLTSTQS